MAAVDRSTPMRDSSLTDSQEHRVARHECVHSVGVGALFVYSDSVALGALGVATISKSSPEDQFPQGPAVTLRKLAVTHDLVTLTDFSMTKGGVVGNVGATVSMVLSVILDSSAETI